MEFPNGPALIDDGRTLVVAQKGQGMASGIRDAINLAWRLGRVVRGESPDTLLNTYESERRPHMTAFVTLAAQMANQIEAMEPHGAEDGAEVPVTGNGDPAPAAW